MEAGRRRGVARFLAIAIAAGGVLTAGALLGCARADAPGEPRAAPEGAHARQADSDVSLGRIRLQPIARPAPTRILVGTTQDSRARECSDTCSLREAIRSAEPGSVVDVPAGVYLLRYGGLLVDKDLVIAGAGPDATFIRAGPRPTGEPLSGLHGTQRPGGDKRNDHRGWERRLGWGHL